MSLRTLAEQDMSSIVTNTSEFGREVTIVDPNGVSATLNGITNDIYLGVETDTNVDVAVHQAEVSLSISELAAEGISIPFGEQDENLKPFRITMTDITGEEKTFKIVVAMPDRSIGLVLCMLDDYEA